VCRVCVCRDRCVWRLPARSEVLRTSRELEDIELYVSRCMKSNSLGIEWQKVFGRLRRSRNIRS